MERGRPPGPPPPPAMAAAKDGGAKAVRILKDSVLPALFKEPRTFKRSARGLFQGKHIHFGNKVSLPNNSKTRRTWKPNVVTKRMYSETLNRHVRIRLVTSALKAIDHSGGLDNYLTHRTHSVLKSHVGSKLKKQIEMKVGLERATRRVKALEAKPERDMSARDRAWLNLHPHIQAQKRLGLRVASLIAIRDAGKELTTKQAQWVDDALLTNGNVPQRPSMPYIRPIAVEPVEGYNPKLRDPKAQAYKLRRMHNAMRVRNRIAARLNGEDV